MKKTFKTVSRCLALIISAVIILTTVLIAPFRISAEEAVYTDTLSLTNYAFIEAEDGSTDVQLAKASIPGPGETGYAIQKTDGSNTFVSGSVVYWFNAAVKDIQFVTGLSNNERFLGYVRFYSSADGESWSELETERTLSNDKWVAGNANIRVYDAVSFEEEAQVRFIKITFNKRNYNAPGLREISYSTYSSGDVLIQYMNEFDIPGGTTDTDKVIASAPAGGGGYHITDSDGVVTGGSMIYYSEEGISDFIIDYAKVSVAAYGYTEFYVSTDGVNWKNAPGTEEKLSKNYAGDGNCYYYQFSGTLLPSAGYKYLRIDIVNPRTNFPVVFSVKYNNAAQMGTENPQIANPDMKDRYEIRKSVNSANTIQAEDYPLTDVYGVGDNLHYSVYAFWDMDAWKNDDKANAWKPGIIEYESEDAITDYRIKGIWNGNGDTINLYASSDGTNWLELDPEVAEVGDFSNPNWGAFTSKWFYGSFKEDSDIHYIRIEMVSRISWLRFLPGMCFMDYNTVNFSGLPTRPQSYANTSVESNYFLQDETYITFKSGSTMTDYDLILKEIEGVTPVVTVSRKGSDWIPCVAVTESAGEGLISMYDTFPAEDGYQYIRIDKTTAEFVELNYNLASGSTDTTRRHYEMIELSEDIEDLDIDKKRLAFSEGNFNGIISWGDNLFPTTNSDQNASYIGGKHGIVAKQGEGSLLITAPNVHDFKLRAAFSGSLDYIHIKAYGRKSENGEETEIPLMRVVAAGYESCGFKNYIFRPANRDEVIAAGYHYIRIEVATERTFSDQIFDFEYFYDLPELVPMPDFEPADTAKGEIEILDKFDAIRLTEDGGGKALDSCYMQKETRSIGVNNPSDVVVRKTYFMAESYVIYKAPELSSFDIRAYKSAECITDLIIYVSADNENWIEVDTTTIERDIYDGFKKVAYKASKTDIGDGMNYIKIEIPDLEGSESELMLYELQLIHTSAELPAEEEEIIEEYEEPQVEEEEPEAAEEELIIEEDVTIEEEPETEADTEEEEEEVSANTAKRKKVVRVRKKAASGLYWYEWALIIGGGALIVIAAAVITIIIVKKRKKAQSEQ